MQARKALVAVFVVSALALGLFAGHRWTLMGLLNPPSAPDATESYTLDDIYDRLDTGATGDKSPFEEPSTSPGTTVGRHSSVKTLSPPLDHGPAM